MHNALELDAGRYVRGGASATILYATRLALRVGLYARAALAPEARGVRGLRNLPDAVRRELAEGSEALRAMVEQRALPVLQACNRRWWGLQPCVMEAASYVMEAATLALTLTPALPLTRAAGLIRPAARTA